MKKIQLTNEQISYIENNQFEIISDIAKYIGCGSTIVRRVLKENNVKLIVNNSLNRECPKCNANLKYSNISARRKADKFNVICKDCSNKEKSIKYKGRGNPFYRKTHSNEFKNKLSNLHKGKSFSKDTEFKKGEITNTKPIYECWINKYGKEIADKKVKIWKSKLSIRNSGKGNPMYGKPSPIGSGNGWSGWYKGWYFRSLLELSYMIKVIERFNLKWENGELKKYKIPYADFEGKQRNYYPDFIINDKYIVECKPKNLWNSINVLSKKEAGIKFAKQNNMIYKLSEIPKLTTGEIKKLVENKEIKLLKRYKEKYEQRYK